MFHIIFRQFPRQILQLWFDEQCKDAKLERSEVKIFFQVYLLGIYTF